MENMLTIKAQRRSVTGKKVKTLRAEGWIPGVAYGPEMDAQPIQFVRKELIEAYRQAGTSALVGLVVGRQRQARPAIIREVQRHPISLEILHVDLQLVDLNRPITTRVPVHLKGKSPVVEQGLAVLTHGVDEVEIRCLPTAVPAYLEVDLSTLIELDQSIHVSHLVVDPGVHILTDPETVIVYATSIRRLEEAEARAEAAAAAEVAVPVEEGAPVEEEGAPAEEKEEKREKKEE